MSPGFAIAIFVTITALVYSIQNLISPNLNTMSNYFGFGGQKTQLGILTATFTILSGVSMVIFGYLADKIVRMKLVFIGSLCYSVSAILVILVGSGPGLTGYVAFFLLQVIAGIGFGILVPNIFSLMGDMVSKKDRAKGFSFFSIATLIGTALGVGLGSAFVDTDWRFGYLIVGIGGMGSSIIVLFLEEPSRMGIDNEFLVDREAREYSYRIKLEDLKYIFKKKSNIWLIVNFVDTIPTGIILFLLFAFLEEEHNVPEDIGIVFLALVLLSTLIGTVIFGFITDKLFQKGRKKARVLFALMANVAPIPFVFIGLLVPFKLPDGGGVLDLFLLPGAVIMLILFMAGLFLNGATNGSWYATVVDINLPEHRGTVLATANFFDIVGRSVGPLIGSILADTFSTLVGMASSIIFWIFIPFFWIPVLKHVIEDMEDTDRIFKERIKDMAS
jgi:MFS family permease